MTSTNLNWIANYIWGIVDEVPRDVHMHGKYHDVILPMTVLRRLDAVLEPTKQAVFGMKATLDAAGVCELGRRAPAGGGAGLPQHLEVRATRPAGKGRQQSDRSQS